MNTQVATSILFVAGEFLTLLREWMTHRRQDQATALKPSADAVKAHIDQLVLQALEREAARGQQGEPAGGQPPAGAAGGLQEHADALKGHIDALVAMAEAGHLPVAVHSVTPTVGGQPVDPPHDGHPL